MKLNPLKVIMVDGNPADIKINIKSLQKEWNIQFKTAETLKDFKELHNQFDPDIVISEYELNGFNWIKVLEIMKAKDPHTPFIILTGKHNEAYAADCFEKGVWDYILKEDKNRINISVRYALQYREQIHKTVKRALGESEELYRVLTESSPDVIMRFDNKCRHIFVNQAVTGTVPIQPEEFINKSHAEMGVFPEHLCRFWEECIGSVFSSGKPKIVEFEIDNENGRVYLEWRLFPEFNKKNKVETVLTIARDITIRKDYERKLKESRQMMELILNNIPQSIFWKDKNSVFLGCNRKFAESAGIKNPIEIIGKTDFDMPWKKEESDFFIKCDRRVISRNRPEFHIIEPRLLADGTNSWNDTNKIPLHDEHGKVIGILGTAENITEKKADQEALKKSRERLRMALEATSEGIWDFSFDTKEIYFSPRYFSMLGYDYTEVKHNFASIYSLLHPDDRYHIRRLIENFLESNHDSVEYELRMRKKDGSYIWILSRGKVFSKDSEGKPLRIVGTHVDITERKKQENIQKLMFGITNAVNTTRNLEELYISIQNTLGSVIDTKNCYVALYDKASDKLTLPFHKDEKDTFTSFPAGNTLTGYVVKTGRSLLVDHSKAEELEREGIIDSVGAPSESWLGVPLKHGNQIIGVFAVQSYDKSTVYTEEDVRILEFVSDQIALAIERKAYETNLKIAKERAEDSDRLKTAFLSNMSHEIRTPMNAIVGFSELLSKTYLSESERNEFIAQINIGAETLMRLIDDIIDISKIEAGQLQIHRTGFVLSDLFNELAITFMKILERNNKDNIRFIQDHGDIFPGIPVYTDRFRLKQIFSNLLSNAIKFTDHGEIRFGIKDIDNKMITFYVKDSGIGIDKEKQKLIFERFRQGHESNDRFYGGTGLGLAISKNLSEILGGSIHVSSEPEKGSEFCFTLKFDTSETTLPVEKTDFSDQVPLLKGKTILIAEDDDSSYIFLEEAFKRSGATILRANDGIEVVELFIENPHTALVLMDIRLPNRDGYEAARIIKSINNSIPVIAQTAYAMAGEKENSKLSGCDGFVSKPIKLTELYSIVRKHVLSG